jgi:hypothetical protein
MAMSLSAIPAWSGTPNRADDMSHLPQPISAEEIWSLAPQTVFAVPNRGLSGSSFRAILNAQTWLYQVSAGPGITHWQVYQRTESAH